MTMTDTSTPAPGTPLQEPATAATQPWVVLDLQVQVLMFYHDNPGTMETVEGLASRLGVDVEDMRKAILAEIAAGLMQERKAGNGTFVVLDRKHPVEMKAVLDRAQTLQKSKGAPA